MAMNIVNYIIGIVVSTVIVSPSLWLSGRIIVGAQKARFIDAVLIVVLGSIVGSLLGAVISGIIGIAIQFVLWLGLIRHYFECGWFTAFVIAIIAVITFVVVTVILGFIGFTLFTIFI